MGTKLCSAAPWAHHALRPTSATWVLLASSPSAAPNLVTSASKKRTWSVNLMQFIPLKQAIIQQRILISRAGYLRELDVALELQRETQQMRAIALQRLRRQYEQLRVRGRLQRCVSFAVWMRGAAREEPQNGRKVQEGRIQPQVPYRQRWLGADSVSRTSRYLLVRR